MVSATAQSALSWFAQGEPKIEGKYTMIRTKSQAATVVSAALLMVAALAAVLTPNAEAAVTYRSCSAINVPGTTSANRVCLYEGDITISGRLYYQRSHIYQSYNYLVGWATWRSRTELWIANNGQWQWNSCKIYDSNGAVYNCY